ncbi:DUF2892 domain-containing protein [Thermodesulfobacteriota bacterium]
MTIDRFILGMAGTLVLLSLLLYLAHSPYWLLLTALVGINLLQSAITGFCPSVKLLKLLGVKPGKAFE